MIIIVVVGNVVMSKKKSRGDKPKIVYPLSRSYKWSYPTKPTKLMICPKCFKAEWVIPNNRVVYCCSSRCREATKKEYEQGIKELKYGEE